VEIALFECCGEKWEWKEVGYLGQGIDKDLLVFCAFCGNYKRLTEGQLDEEEVWGWLGMSDKEKCIMERLCGQIDKLTKKHNKILIEGYKNL
jgi:hypothetical protein